ncbi:hypothetical protein [Shinella sp. NM-101]|uniref:hypothetical protein n=1 Tax=Shinella sp. NM-101 TaxID=2744455 RepID=UPI001F3A2166|nr:hypothetical protein [Shinella sp. NM-101]
MTANASSSSAWPTMRASAGAMSLLNENVTMAKGRLEDVVAMWPTPAARDHKGANSPDHLESGTGRKHLDQLPNFVEHLWYTPNVPNGGRTLSAEATATGMTPEGRKQQVGLENQARFWSTPRASDGEKGGPNQAFGLGGGAPLPAQTANWATPTSLSYGDSHQPGNSRNQNINLDLAKALYSRLAHPTYQVGRTSSHPRRSLNPLFVEWLMGWPRGWTLLAWTDFACSATGLSRYRQHMRSAFLRLDLPPEAPPAQLALFG